MTFLISWKLLRNLSCSVTEEQRLWLAEQGKSINAVVCDTSVMKAYAELSEDDAASDNACRAANLLRFVDMSFAPACRVPMPRKDVVGMPEIVDVLSGVGEEHFLFPHEVHEALRYRRTYLCSNADEQLWITELFPNISAVKFSDQIRG